MLKPTDVVVVLFHDHATRYMGKAFNDEWMKERGFLDAKPKTAGSLKAKNCVEGYNMLIDFCNENKIPYDLCGKLVVATC